MIMKDISPQGLGHLANYRGPVLPTYVDFSDFWQALLVWYRHIFDTEVFAPWFLFLLAKC